LDPQRSGIDGNDYHPAHTSHSASKFAVQGLCEALRAELAGHFQRNSIRSLRQSVRDSSKRIFLAVRLGGTGRDCTALGSMDETTANGAEPIRSDGCCRQDSGFGGEWQERFCGGGVNQLRQGCNMVAAALSVCLLQKFFIGVKRFEKGKKEEPQRTGSI